MNELYKLQSSGRSVGTVREFFQLINCERGHTIRAYVPRPYAEGPICEQCWLEFGMVHGKDTWLCLPCQEGQGDEQIPPLEGSRLSNQELL